MKCPNCNTYGQLKAEKGNIPISEDIISCEYCSHTLTDNERSYLEAQVVEQRKIWEKSDDTYYE